MYIRKVLALYIHVQTCMCCVIVCVTVWVAVLSLDVTDPQLVQYAGAVLAEDTSVE